MRLEFPIRRFYLEFLMALQSVLRPLLIAPYNNPKFSHF
jgi:hypothetical protein